MPLNEGQIRSLIARVVESSSDHDLNAHLVLPPDRKLRPAAVLVPIRLAPDGARLILTKRSSQLSHHPGQVAFPGGKIDPGDASAEAAALREAREEIGLDPAQVRILGPLPPHETVTNFIITPIVGLIEGAFHPRPEAGEVEEVFEVPLSHVLNPRRYRVERRRWLGGWRYYYTVPWGPYYIWGATARMLRSLAEARQAAVTAAERTQ